MFQYGFKILILCIMCAFSLFLSKSFDDVPNDENVSEVKEDKKEVYVQVVSEKRNQAVPLEEYLIGVVASEMPYTFELEALKAQSVASRTFVLNRNLKVDDTTSSQVYRSISELKEIYEEDFEMMYKRVKEAVYATKNQILTYNGKTISALFYSCNNGKSNDASWYYTNEVPYLKSVESAWDLSYKGCKSSVEINKSTICNQLGIDSFNVSDFYFYPNGYVESVTIGGKQFSGREIREKLKLRSSCFHFSDLGNEVLIMCVGYGHGVGMSQYGADGMAKEGYTYDEILKHYYSGVQIETISDSSE